MSRASLGTAASGFVGHNLRALAIGLLVGGLAMLAAAFARGLNAQTHAWFILGWMLFGFGAGLFAIRTRWFDARAAVGSQANSWRFCGTVVLLAAGIAAFVWHCGMRQFGGFDHSVVVDVGWRLLGGQRAHVDFPCTLPVGFILGSKYAFRLLGVQWQSLVIVAAGFSALTFIWSVGLLIRLFENRFQALLLGLTLQATTLMLVAYWWYNPITSVAAVIYLLSATLWLDEPRSNGAAVSYLMALLLLAGMKPNLAGILIPLVSLVLVFQSPQRVKVLLLSLIAFVAFVLWLRLNNLSLLNLLGGYLAAAQRGASTKQFLQDLGRAEKALSLAGLGLVLLPALVCAAKKPRAFLSWRPWVGTIGVLAGCYGFLTNGELKLVDLPPILFGSIILVAKLATLASPPAAFQTLPPAWSRYFTLFCAGSLCMGIGQGLARDRVKAIQLGAFFEFKLSEQVPREGFFKGMRIGPILTEVNQQLADALLKADQHNAKVYFGPRMQWAYAAFHKPSPVNQPIWWHPGVAFTLGEEDKYMHALLEGHYDTLIFLKSDNPAFRFAGQCDVVYFSPQFVRALLERYTVDEASYSRINVLHRIAPPHHE